MSNKPSWIDDLFGGRDKGYEIKDDSGNVIGTGTVSQTSEDRQRNEGNKGDYPHTTRDVNDNWHRSEDKSTHSSTWNLFGSNDDDDSNDDSGSSEEGNSWNLFG
jgi:hypothetical protein